MINNSKKTVLSFILIFVMLSLNISSTFASDVILSNKPSNIVDTKGGFLGSNKIYSSNLFIDKLNGPNTKPMDGIIVDYDYNTANNQSNNITISLSTNSNMNVINNQVYNNVQQVIGFSNTFNNFKIQNSDTNTTDAGPTVREIKSPAENEARIRENNNSKNTIGNVSSNSPSQTTNQSVNASVSSQSTYQTNMSEAISYQLANVSVAQPSISTPAAILVNASTNQIYYSKGVNIV